MKTLKNYRLSPMTLQVLASIKQLPQYANYTETDIIEAAIWHLHHTATTTDSTKEDQA